MYAIVKTGGKQYRVQQGQSLLVERLPVGDGERVSLQPLLYVDGSEVIDGADQLARVTVGARVLAHERGPKLRVVKFKPKRGYKRRTGHRQELTRLEVTEIRFELGGEAAAAASAAAEPATAAASAEPATAPEPAEPAGGADAVEPASATEGAEPGGAADGAELAGAVEGAEPATAAEAAERPTPSESESEEANNGA